MCPASRAEAVTSTHHVAQLNIAAMRESMDSPVMVDFVANLDRINAIADSAPGFVWRLKGDPPENPFGAMTLVNISVSNLLPARA
jgi:hypothetical protein